MVDARVVLVATPAADVLVCADELFVVPAAVVLVCAEELFVVADRVLVAPVVAPPRVVTTGAPVVAVDVTAAPETVEDAFEDVADDETPEVEEAKLLAVEVVAATDDAVVPTAAAAALLVVKEVDDAAREDVAEPTKRPEEVEATDASEELEATEATLELAVVPNVPDRAVVVELFVVVPSAVVDPTAFEDDESAVDATDKVPAPVEVLASDELLVTDAAVLDSAVVDTEPRLLDAATAFTVVTGGEMSELARNIATITEHTARHRINGDFAIRTENSSYAAVEIKVKC